MKKVAIISFGTGGTMGHMTLTTKLAHSLSKNKNVSVTVFSEYNYARYTNVRSSDVNYIKLKKPKSKYTVSGCLSYRFKRSLLNKILQIKPDILIFSTFFDPEITITARKHGIKILLVSYPLRDSHRKVFLLRKYYQLFDRVFTLRDLHPIKKIYPNELIVSPIKTISDKKPNLRKQIGTILITCGGATRPSANLFFVKIKKIIPRLLKDYPNLKFNLVKAGFNEKLSLPKTKLISWSNNFSDLLMDSDLIISEAGYFTVMDLISLKKPAILIPGERRIDNQELRAVEFESMGCGVMLLPIQESQFLKHAVTSILEKPNELKKMIKNLQKLNKKIGFNKMAVDKAVLEELSSIKHLF